MLKSIMYLDGQYLPIEPVLLDIFTPGRIRWRGVFETMRCAHGEIEFLDEHLNRLMAGLKALRVQHTHTISGLKRICRQVLKRSSLFRIGRLRLMVFQLGSNVHCLAMVTKYKPPSASQYRRGLRVKLVKTNRPATARWANVKSLDYGMFADAYKQAKSAGFDEALLINRKGHIFEASRGNIFLVLNGQLLTPPLSSGCLNGVIRQQVIKTARNLKVAFQEQNITPAMLKATGKVFLSNSLLGLVPAVMSRR